MKVLTTVVLVASASLATSRNLLFPGNPQHALSDTQGASIPGKNPLTYCESTDGYILDIDYINITPNPPVIGELFEIEAQGTLAKNITEGAYIILEVSFGFIKLLHQTVSLCDQVGNVNLSCPVEKGEVKIVKSASIPKEAPPGQYTVRADVYNADEEKITCLLGEKIPMHK
jgi:hypothetical protein